LISKPFCRRTETTEVFMSAWNIRKRRKKRTRGILEHIKSERQAQMSYSVGTGDEAMVIYLRRNCEVYIELARQF